MSWIRNTTKNGLYVLQVPDLMVHILARAYTASNPWLTDCDSRLANSWLLKIFRLHPGKKCSEKNLRFSSFIYQKNNYFCHKCSTQINWLTYDKSLKKLNSDSCHRIRIVISMLMPIRIRISIKTMPILMRILPQVLHI